MALKILINGARGRMGRALIEAAPTAGCEVVAAIDQGDDFAGLIAQAEAIIDFSFHSATVPLLQSAATQGKPVVIGTTGHTAEERATITALASRLPIVWAGNYSVGVNLLFHLTRQAAQILGEDFHPEVLELHHRHKADAPSGTAVNLVENILSPRGWSEADIVHGREGITGARPDRQVGVHAIRGGEIIGEHTVFFIGANERIELSHRASNRGIFAGGALRAAKWLAEGRPAGLYNMQDVLGLR